MSNALKNSVNKIECLNQENVDFDLSFDLHMIANVKFSMSITIRGALCSISSNELKRTEALFIHRFVLL